MNRSPSLWLHQMSARLSTLPAGRTLTATDRPRPKGTLIWVHCPAPETEPVIAEILRHLIDSDPDLILLVTKTDDTPISLSSEPGATVLSVPVPAESGAAARGFADHWAPDACLFFTRGLLPAHMAEAHSRGVPVFLIGNGSIEDGLSGPALRGLAARAILKRINHVFAETSAWADTYRRQGVLAERLTVTGPLSKGTVLLPCNEAERDRMARIMAGRPTWLAAGLGQDEEEVALTAYHAAARHSHRLLMFLEPDDPGRGAALARRLSQSGLTVGMRSAGDMPDPETQIFIADEPGELGLWYRLAPVCLIGHTFGAGQPGDPLAPAALGSAILHGPKTAGFETVFSYLDDAGASRALSDGTDLATAVSELLSPDVAALYARNAWEVSTAGAEATAKVAETLSQAVQRRDKA